DIDEFVLKEWIEDAKEGSMKQVMNIIDGLIFRSLYFLSYGDTDAAASHEKLAQGIYLHYKQAQNESWGRVGLPPYPEIKQKIVDNCLANFPKPVSESLRSALEEQKELKKEDQTPPKDK
ncbi:MAG: hypothetical protein NT118_03910, partial [Lentisphaerae bacterium]|nr:hypothetical protein [Lentisphaerota bacterium]